MTFAGTSETVEWIDPGRTWIADDGALEGFAAVDSQGMWCTRENVTPIGIWDPLGTGYEASFGPLTVRHTPGRIHIEHGFLDGHQWLIAPNGDRFTTDAACLPGLPNMSTDLDTALRRCDEHYELSAAKDTVELRNATIAVSAEPSNWGSFLSRVVPKLAHRTPRRKTLAYLHHANQRALAELMGIRTEMLINHEPYRRYELHDCTIDLLPASNLWVSAEQKQIYRRIAKRAQRAVGEESYPPLLYLSRLGSLGAQAARSFVNEPEFAAGLEALGFVVIRPEDVRLDWLIAALSKARLVVAAGGAGMFNMVFTGNATVIDIESERTWLFGHVHLLQSAARRWGLIYGAPTSPEDTAVHRPWSVDVAASLDVIRETMASA